MKPVCLASTLQVSPLILFATLFSEVNPALAQVVPDNTLGAESSTVNPRDETSDKIDGGAVRGQNLFHSFQEFNVGEGRGVYFSNPDAVSNIFSRVTGNNVSNILGTLGVDGAANLYLINPNGIIFGQNAALDVQGSFTATTADAVEFGDNGFFSAVAPGESLLTISVPLGLQLGSNSGSIINRSFVQDSTGDFVGLQVPSGENLTLVGGDVSFEAGEATAKGGNIFIGGLSESGTVAINDDGSLSFPVDVAKADITLSNAADVDVRGTGGGSVTVNARNVNIEAGDFGSSQIRAGITADSTSTDARAEDITIDATDTITVSEGSSIINLVEQNGIGSSGGINITTADLFITQGSRVIASTFGEGNGGKIEITTGSLVLTNGASLDTRTSGLGDAGDIFIEAQEITFSGSSIFTEVSSDGGIGNAGDINISTDSLLLQNGSFFLADTENQGDAGNILIEAEDSVVLEGIGENDSQNQITSTVDASNNLDVTGNAGNIEINTGSLSISDGGFISTNTDGQGNGGKITVNASNFVSIGNEESNGNLFSNVGSNAVGNSKGIEINTGSLVLANGSSLDTRTSGVGDAGDVSMEAQEITFSGSSIFTEVSSDGGIGNAGDINISTNSLLLQNGSSFLADTENQGDAGNIVIEAEDSVVLEGRVENNVNQITSTVDTGTDNAGIDFLGVGNAGNIEINTGSLSITDGGFISTNTSGEGDGGSILINADDSVFLTSSNISSNVNSGAVGNSGGIDITTGSLSVNNGAQIQSLTAGKGNSGKIVIKSSNIVSFDGRDMSESPSGAFSLVNEGGIGDAGGIEIFASSLSMSNRAQLLSNTRGKGNAGDIDIQVGEEFRLVNSDIISEITEGLGEGEGGDITIKTGSLLLQNGSSLLADTENIGNAGDITIEASESVIVEGEGLAASNPDRIIPSQITSTVDRFEGARGEGGNISISTPFLSLADGGFIRTSTLNLGDAGNVKIEADNISVSGFDEDGFGSFIASSVGQAEAEGNGGSVEIITDNLSVTNAGQISVSTSGAGDAGDLSIFANSIEIDGGEDNLFTGLFAQVNQNATGEGGSINLGSEQSLIKQLTLVNGARISADTFDEGNAGGINIYSGGSISLENSNIFSEVNSDAVGNAGTTKIITNTLTLTNSSIIGNRVFGEGEGGSINLGSKQSPIEQLNITDGALITVDTLGEGDAGDLSIFANNIEINAGEEGFNTGFLAQVREDATGQGGNISIGSEQFSVQQLSVVNGSGVSVSTFGQGNAGNLFIFANNLELDGRKDGFDTGLFAQVRENATGKGGNINLGSEQFSIEQLNINNGAEIVVSTSGRGKAGEIQIYTNYLNLDNDALIVSRSETNFDAGNITLKIANSLQAKDSEISTSSTQSSGGNLTITAGNIELRGDSDFTTNIVSGEGSGGNITINTDSIIAFDDSDIFASAPEGKGGDIKLNTNVFFAENFTLNSLTVKDTENLNNNSRADVNATGTTSGQVSIPDVSFIQNSLTELPNNSIDTDELVANSCVVPAGERGKGTFIITGGESLPVRPGDNLPSKYPTGEVRNVPENNNSSWQPGDPIIEPQGVYRLTNGKLVLSRECN